MIILYGFGQYINMIMEKYYIPSKEIEIIIDNELAKRNVGIGQIKVISFDEYLSSRKKYRADCFVIGAKARFKEIKKQLIEQAGVEEKSIMFVDEWVYEHGSRIDTYLNEESKKSARDYIGSLMSETGQIPEKALRETKILTSREKVCELIPKGLVAAEIGVAFGGFSTCILQKGLPQKFFAIDMFSDKTAGFWGKNVFQEEGITHYEWYAGKFQEYIDRNILEMRRGISWECLETFPDDYFDYVYLDAGHDYGSVKRDIDVLKRVVKRGGIIQFNDYGHCEWYGVVPAVNELIRDTSSKVMYYCLSMNGMDDIVVQLAK